MNLEYFGRANLPSTRHIWNNNEEIRLFELYTIHGGNWRIIVDILNQEFDCSLAEEQVKNKFYKLQRNHTPQTTTF